MNDANNPHQGFGKLVDMWRLQKRPAKNNRPRKDYHVHETIFESLADLKTTLKQYIDNACADPQSPQYCSVCLTLSSAGALPLPDGPYVRLGPNYLPSEKSTSNTPNGSPGENGERGGETGQGNTKTVSELCNLQDGDERHISQRAAARGVASSIQEIDGFKYSFNNNWCGKDDNGFRFSYTCLDSLENKDRHANGFRATNAARRRPGAGSRGSRKPTYDCRGQIAVKFFGAKQIMQVVYKHVPIHKTVAERRPPPRKRSEGRRQGEGDESEEGDFASFVDGDGGEDESLTPGDLSSMIQAHSAPSSAPPHLAKDPIYPEVAPYSSPYSHAQLAQPARVAPQSQTGNVGAKGRKTAKKGDKSQPEPEKSLSLVELLKESMGPEPAPHPTIGQPITPTPPRPVGRPAVDAPSPHETNAPFYGFAAQEQQQIKTACFACMRKQNECDKALPQCLSCRSQGTACGYPSVIRFNMTTIQPPQTPADMDRLCE